MYLPDAWILFGYIGLGIEQQEGFAMRFWQLGHEMSVASKAYIQYVYSTSFFFSPFSQWVRLHLSTTNVLHTYSTMPT